MAPDGTKHNSRQMENKEPELEENEETGEPEAETEAEEEESEPPSHLPFAPPSSSEVTASLHFSQVAH